MQKEAPNNNDCTCIANVLNEAPNRNGATSVTNNMRLTTIDVKQFSMAVVYPIIIIQKSQLTRNER